MTFSRLFYNAQTNEWPFRDLWLTKQLLHDAAQNISKLIGILLLLLMMSSFFLSALKQHTKLLSFLFIASISGPALIAILKSSTHIYCPWNLTLFGGDKPYIHLFDRVDPTLPIGHCFPGGHSGSGFTFVSLYYFLLLIKPTYKFHALGLSLLIGSIFAITQAIRGAHFLSHDVFSLLICWVSASMLFIVFFHQQLTWTNNQSLIKE